MSEKIHDCMVQYLLETTFHTKKDMAAHIGVPYRQLLGVSVGKGSSHSELEVTDHNLTADGEEVYASMLQFLRKASARVCPSCKTWCNPWDGKHHAEQIDCFIGHMAREIIKDISEFHKQEGEHHDPH